MRIERRAAEANGRFARRSAPAPSPEFLSERRPDFIVDGAASQTLSFVPVRYCNSTQSICFRPYAEAGMAVRSRSDGPIQTDRIRSSPCSVATSGLDRVFLEQ